jgi:hypothetical protein
MTCSTVMGITSYVKFVSRVFGHYIAMNVRPQMCMEFIIRYKT